MGKPIPTDFLDLFQKPAFAHLATLMPDGSPQITPVWVDYDGEHIIINSKIGRRKNSNMAARAQVAVEIMDPANPYRYLTVRGRVIEIIEEGASAHVDKLTQRYLGIAEYPWGAPGEMRQLFKIEIDHILTRFIADVNDYPVAHQPKS